MDIATLIVVAQLIDCTPQYPGRDAPGQWSWRTIDGRKCWYPGKPGLPRERLRWPTAPDEAAEKAFGMEGPEEEETEFSKRWRGAPE